MEAALVLAAQGLPVFPCRENKAPACPHGFKDASAEPDRIRELWRKHPGPLIGVPTGPASGFDVLDLDPRHGAASWMEIFGARLPATRIHVTRSGGWHMFFAADPAIRNSAGRVGPGVDVRGTGGFIVWWPIAGGAIQSDAPIPPWPRWLKHKAMPPAPANHSPSSTNDLKPPTRLLEIVVGRAINRVQSAPAGQLHYNLRAAACTLGGVMQDAGLSEGEIVRTLVAAAQSAGAVDIRNAERTALWGIKRGREAPLKFDGQRQ